MCAMELIFNKEEFQTAVMQKVRVFWFLAEFQKHPSVSPSELTRMWNSQVTCIYDPPIRILQSAFSIQMRENPLLSLYTNEEGKIEEQYLKILSRKILLRTLNNANLGSILKVCKPSKKLISCTKCHQH